MAVGDDESSQESAPFVLKLLRGFVGACLGIVICGFGIPILLATITSFVLNDLGGPGFWVLIAIPSGILGALYGAQKLIGTGKT